MYVGGDHDHRKPLDEAGESDNPSIDSKVLGHNEDGEDKDGEDDKCEDGEEILNDMVIENENRNKAQI